MCQTMCRRGDAFTSYELWRTRGELQPLMRSIVIKRVLLLALKKRVLLLKFTVYVEYPGKEQETTGPLHFLNPSTMLKWV